MFGDQTPSNVVWWPNMLVLKWVAKQLKHVWSNTDETIDTSRWANVVRMPASNMFDSRLSKRTKHHPSNTRTIEIFYAFDRMLEGLQILSNTTKHDQTRWNSTKQGVQTVNCLGTKQYLMVFGRQTFIVCPGPYTPIVAGIQVPFTHFFKKLYWCKMLDSANWGNIFFTRFNFKQITSVPL